MSDEVFDSIDLFSVVLYLQILHCALFKVMCGCFSGICPRL